jgi:glycosyltransferase involved in cell wall biosynthesis
VTVADPPRRVNVFVPTLALSDAVSDQARRRVRLLREWGHDAELVAERWHSACAAEVLPLPYALGRRGDAAWLVHYSIWTEGLADVVRASGRPRALTYHNVTPHELLPAGPVADLCRRAREELPGLAGKGWDLVTADSSYNADELRAAGFGSVEVVPLLLPRGRPVPDAPRGGGILFVGRLAPSKGLDDLIKAVALLRLRHRPEATLDIVGSRAGWEGYVAGLERLAGRIGCGGITFRGQVSDAERDALYARAGVVCLMSRHEGFCAPLVEAMRAGAPVVARDAGAVAETLGGGGVLLPDGDPRLAAEALEAVLGDEALRARLRGGAATAVGRVDPEVVEARLLATIGAMLGVRATAARERGRSLPPS